MKKYKTLISCTLLLLFSLLSAGCTKNKKIEFDSSDPLALATDIEWAVVADPYVAFRSAPGYEQSVINYGRVGDILMVKGKSYHTEKNSQTLWYEFEKGWLDVNVISVYDNKLKAKSSSQALLNK